MQAKVCGLKTAEEVESCIKYGADFCGFILNYKKSHRFIDFETAKKITSVEKKKTFYVGVLVNPSLEELKTFSSLNLDYFQIYGNFNKYEIKKIKDKYKKKIILALQIKEERDILKYKEYQDVADIILFDSSGLNKSLSWNYDWIREVPKNITKMIGGNINIDLLDNLKKITDIVDVSGALETNKVKDNNKIKNFLDKIEQIND